MMDKCCTYSHRPTPPDEQKGEAEDKGEDDNVCMMVTQRTCMGAHWHTKLGSHEHDCKHLVDATKAAGINLTKVNCLGLEKLLEHDTVLAHFASGDANSQFCKHQQKA